jgi:hypothetical protein
MGSSDVQRADVAGVLNELNPVIAVGACLSA